MGVLVVTVVRLIGVATLSAAMASVNGGHEHQIDDEEESAQHQGDAQSRLIGPEHVEPVADRGRRVDTDASDAATAVVSGDGDGSARFGRHHVRVDDIPLGQT